MAIIHAGERDIRFFVYNLCKTHGKAVLILKAQDTPLFALLMMS